ncbi:hypothetical protein EMCRGX_G027232 [Ephydatia muelleri]
MLVPEKKDEEAMGLKKLWKWLPLGDKDNFSAAVMRLMFSNDTPVIVSGNIGIFTMVMSTFQQYEKAGNPNGSHGNLLKRIVKCLKESDVFEKDFPFYIILAYRIRLNKIYMGDNAPQFFATIMDKMETLDTHKLSTTLDAFLLRHQVALFATHLSYSLCLPTIRVYLAAVSFLHHISGHRSPVSSNPIPMLVIHGIRRNQAQFWCIAPRLPITPQILSDLMEQLDCDSASPRRTGSCLGQPCLHQFLRVSQFTAPAFFSCTSHRFLTTDLQFVRHQLLRRSKTD